MPSERAASTTFEVFGMIWPGIEPITSRSQSRLPTEAIVSVQIEGPNIWGKYSK